MNKKRIGISVLLSVMILTMLAIYVLAGTPGITLDTSVAPTNNSIIAGTIAVSVTTNISANVTFLITNYTGPSGNITSNWSTVLATAHNFSWVTTNGSFPYGVYNITIKAMNDTNGTGTTFVIANVTVDNLVPNVTTISPTSSTNVSGNVNITANITDNSAITGMNYSIINSSGAYVLNSSFSSGSGVLRYSLWATASYPDGVYNISINATDTVNNSNYSVSSISSLTVDNTAPVVVPLTPTDNANMTSTQNATINLTITDATTSVVSVLFFIYNSSGNTTETFTPTNSGSNYSVNFNTSNTTKYADGIYNISVNASDTLNNIRYNTSVLRFTVDNTAPVVSSLQNSPVNYANVTGASVLINLSITDATTAVMNVTFSIVGPTQTIAVTPTRNGNNFSFTWVTNNGTYLNGTTYNISIVANDSLGNTLTNTSVLRLTVDNAVPVVTLNSPANTANVSGTQTINVTATDVGSAVSTVQFGIVNSVGSTIQWLTATKSSNTYTASWATSNGSYADGTYNISVNATDAAGNILSNVSVFRAIVVDNTVPGVTGRLATASSTALAFTVAINTSEITNETLAYGTSASSLTSSSTGASFLNNRSITISTGLASQTQYFYNITVCDNAQNCNTTGPFNVTTNFVEPSTGGGTSSDVATSAPTVTYSGLTVVGAKVERVINAVGEVVKLASLPGQAETHTVTYNSADVDAQTVTVTIASTPKVLTIGVGQSQKVDLNDDNTYDLLVTLSSFTSASNFKLKFEVLDGKEQVVPTPVVPATSTETTTTPTNGTVGDTTTPTTTPPTGDTKTTAPAPKTTDTTASGGLGTGVWALIIIVVLLVLWYGWKAMSKKK